MYSPGLIGRNGSSRPNHILPAFSCRSAPFWLQSRRPCVSVNETVIFRSAPAISVQSGSETSPVRRRNQSSEHRSQVCFQRTSGSGVRSVRLGELLRVRRLFLQLGDHIMSRLFFVLGDDFMSWTEHLDSPVAEPHADLAHPPNRRTLPIPWLPKIAA
jgi:hypothetical protein